MKIGFIGSGNMGAALARAVRRGMPMAEVFVTNRSPEKALVLAEEIGGTAADNRTAAARADILFLGVKPGIVPEVLGELAPCLEERAEKPLLVSMAARVPLAELEELAAGCPVIRIMPNTPVSVGKGVTLYTCGGHVSQREKEGLLGALAASGELIEIPESQMAAAGALAGCGPAFVDLFLEALADGGVACGLPRDLSLRLAEAMTAGAAQLALETGQHPGALKDAVCSPGGSTIRGVRALEKGGFRSTVLEAVLASMGF